MLDWTTRGLYCPIADFYIDPWESVERAVITHAHADHARPGCRHYLATRPSETILRHRLGHEIDLQLIDYGQILTLGGLKLSLHPAGHILGSAQVRIERSGEVWVVSGDYKTDPDPTCTPFEPILCHTFVTESTFGLPIFNWPPQSNVWRAINSWWQENRAKGDTCLLFAYALGKAQRILKGLDSSIGPIFTHGAVETINTFYRERDILLPDTRYVSNSDHPNAYRGAMVIAPPSAANGPWMRRFKHLSRGFVSGWMHIRGHRRRRAVDRGFVLSDHCDWQGLNTAIQETGAESVWVTHGYPAELARWLEEKGLHAYGLDSPIVGDTQPPGTDR